MDTPESACAFHPLNTVDKHVNNEQSNSEDENTCAVLCRLWKETLITFGFHLDRVFTLKVPITKIVC